QPATPSMAPSGGSSPMGSGAVTVVGETLRIQGTLTSGEEIVVNGEVRGQLELNHRLTIGPKGKVEAGIKAKEVIIAGSVEGNGDAGERITLRAGRDTAV